VSRFGSYAGAGLAASGLFAGRGEDELGIGLASARNGSHYMEQQAQPDPALKDALAFLLRFEISF
jgi:carbohydrate-selective porin OprB